MTDKEDQHDVSAAAPPRRLPKGVVLGPDGKPFVTLCLTPQCSTFFFYANASLSVLVVVPALTSALGER